MIIAIVEESNVPWIGTNAPKTFFTGSQSV
jgi:hypothetical protein